MYPDARDEVVQLYLDDIIPNRFQPREVFDEKALKELAVSIKEHGVIQPIIVRNVNGKYEIIAGERRYKASALAGLTKIPAIIRDLDDKESSKVALLENLQRKNLNPIEEARTYQKILEIDQMTQEELAKTMGKSQSAVANKIRLLSLPDEIQDTLLKEQISERHARTLLNIPDSKKQKEMVRKIIDEKMSVRSLEEEIKKLYPKEENSKASGLDTEDVQVASASAFVDNKPLAPTAELPEDMSLNYGKVTIAPPTEEEPSDKFSSDNEKEENDENVLLNIPPIIDSTNEEQKLETKEPKNEETKKEPENIADLDSLLNLNKKDSSISDNNYVTPIEEIAKASSEKENVNINTNSDYFEIPDMSDLNGTTSNPEQLKNNNYTIKEATDKIKNLIEELKNHGIKVATDEMDFEKSYQIIIKIDKSENN